MQDYDHDGRCCTPDCRKAIDDPDEVFCLECRTRFEQVYQREVAKIKAELHIARTNDRKEAH